jgi:DNA polymerase III subunit gamma/tau
MKRHWECVRWLCAGIHPEEKPWDRAARVPRPLYELLGIPKNELRLAGLIEGQRRPSASRALLPSTVSAISIGMPFLSAFNDEAWDYVTADWELDEYEVRKVILKEHREEEEKRKALYSENDEQGSQFQNEMSRLRERWSADHRDWKRAWHVWWATPEI